MGYLGGGKAFIGIGSIVFKQAKRAGLTAIGYMLYFYIRAYTHTSGFRRMLLTIDR